MVSEVISRGELDDALRFRTHDDLRGRRGASDALGLFVVAVETSTKKCPKPGSNSIYTFSMFIVCDVRDIY